MTDLLAPGTEMLLRYRYADGGMQAALPMRVVAHSTELLASWLAPATEIRYWATSDGTDPRELPIELRFAAPLSTAPRVWQGTGALHLIRPDVPYQVLLFPEDDEGPAHWYVNLERPVVRSGARFDSVDQQLDLVIDADGDARWKDLDEALFAVGTPFLPLDDLLAARATGLSVLRDVRTFLEPYRSWWDFEPDPAWPIPRLPADWAA